MNIDEAHRCLCGYLSGTRDWWAGRLEEEIKASKDFQIQGFSNFRKKAAQQIRDKRLGKHSLSFLHQAIRFRGKANYREALYLAHGVSVESTISDFIEDMADVLEAFLAMAGAFAFQKIGSELSSDFLEDLDKFRSFSLDPRSVWT